jgi:hypothetical protein
MMRGKLLPFTRPLPAFILICFCLTVTPSSHALVALDSLLLGSFSDQYKKEIEDPIAAIFNSDIYDEAKPGQSSIYKKNLSLYRGFIQEGQNLKKSCEKSIKPVYETRKLYNQAKRSFLASLQYMGLDLTARYLPHYAAYFEFSEQEYSNLVDGLVGNYCSQNLSTISVRQLKKNLLFKFKYKDKVDFPSVLGNPLFSDRLDRLSTMNENRKREFAMTIELFKSFCSWGGDVNNYRMLTAFIKNPVLAAHTIRSLAGEKIIWNNKKEEARIVSDTKPQQVMCRNFICRKTSPVSFRRYFPKAIGSKNVREDLNRLYCHDLNLAEYQYKHQPPKVAQMIKKSSLEHEHMLTGQMIALTTGIPHFMLQTSSFKQVQDSLRASVDRVWDEWASSQKDLHKRSLLYEESLTIEVIPRNFQDIAIDKNIYVNLDLNVGELDRTSEVTGKLSHKFSVLLTKPYVKWLKDSLSARKSDVDIDQIPHLMESLEARIAKGLFELESKIDLVPWKKGLESIIARNIIEQMISSERIHGRTLAIEMKVPIQFNYGLFALRYIRYLHKSEKARRLYEEEKKQNELIKKSLAQQM